MDIVETAGEVLRVGYREMKSCAFETYLEAPEDERLADELINELEAAIDDENALSDERDRLVTFLEQEWGRMFRGHHKTQVLKSRSQRVRTYLDAIDEV